MMKQYENMVEVVFFVNSWYFFKCVCLVVLGWGYIYIVDVLLVGIGVDSLSEVPGCSFGNYIR